MSSYLPDKESTEAKLLIEAYPTASQEKIREWSKLYGYARYKNFEDAVFGYYSVRRLPTVHQSNEGWEPSAINVPLRISLSKEPKTVMTLFDTHNPFQDEQTMGLVERFMAKTMPDFLIYGGDANDFYPISTFDKNPSRINNLQADLNNTRAMFARHRVILPETEMFLLAGNHCDRLQRFLWSEAPALASLKSLQIEELLTLKEYGIKFIPYEQGLMINDVFLVLHGDIASIHSGYTAKRMYEKHGGCGISGHCHRGGSFYKRDRFGTWGWWEGFCLCHLNPDWIKNPNWVQGFSLIHFRGKRFWVEQIPIIEHKFIYGGSVYE